MILAYFKVSVAMFLVSVVIGVYEKVRNLFLHPDGPIQDCLDPIVHRPA